MNNLMDEKNYWFGNYFSLSPKFISNIFINQMSNNWMGIEASRNDFYSFDYQTIDR